MTYAGAFRRFFAFVIDCFVLIGIFMGFGLLLGLSFFLQLIQALSMLGFWFFGGLFICTWIYFAIFESSSWQATIGKKLLDLKVIDLQGRRLSFFRATARYFSKFLSRFIFMIGFLMIFWTKKKQSLHDKIASTIVVHRNNFF